MFDPEVTPAYVAERHMIVSSAVFHASNCRHIRYDHHDAETLHPDVLVSCHVSVKFKSQPDEAWLCNAAQRPVTVGVCAAVFIHDRSGISFVTQSSQSRRLRRAARPTDYYMAQELTREIDTGSTLKTNPPGNLKIMDTSAQRSSGRRKPAAASLKLSLRVIVVAVSAVLALIAIGTYGLCIFAAKYQSAFFAISSLAASLAAASRICFRSSNCYDEVANHATNGGSFGQLS